jgi:hypothetical protein
MSIRCTIDAELVRSRGLALAVRITDLLPGFISRILGMGDHGQASDAAENQHQLPAMWSVTGS